MQNEDQEITALCEEFHLPPGVTSHVSVALHRFAERYDAAVEREARQRRDEWRDGKTFEQFLSELRGSTVPA